MGLSGHEKWDHMSAVAFQAHRAAMVRWGCEFGKVCLGRSREDAARAGRVFEFSVEGPAGDRIA
jgi:hypothetical protein